MKIKILIFLSLSILIRFLSYGEDCFQDIMADFCGSSSEKVAGKYILVFKKFEISEDGKEFIVLGENKDGFKVNLASNNALTEINKFIANKNIPPASYYYTRTTISRQVFIKGMAYSKGYYFYTTSKLGRYEKDPNFYLAGVCESWDQLANIPSGRGCVDYEGVSFRVPESILARSNDIVNIKFTNQNEDIIVTRKLTKPIIVDDKGEFKLNIKFYVDSMIGFKLGQGKCVFYPVVSLDFY